jgi:hypothetical protein
MLLRTLHTRQSKEGDAVLQILVAMSALAFLGADDPQEDRSTITMDALEQTCFQGDRWVCEGAVVIFTDGRVGALKRSPGGTLTVCIREGENLCAIRTNADLQYISRITVADENGRVVRQVTS